MDALAHELYVCHAELELQASQLRDSQASQSAANRRYERLFDLAPVGYAVLDSRGFIRSMNQTCIEMLGTQGAAVDRRSFANFVNHEDRHLYLGALRRTLSEAKRQVVELRCRPAQGEDLWVLFTSTPCPASSCNEKEVLCALVDISRNKQAEDERRAMADRVEHMQRLESLGILAGGIAHDFNNILSAIIGYSQLAERLVAQDSEVHALMAEINRAGTRAAELTQQILAFSRRQEHTHEEVWPHDIIREVTQLLKGSLPSTIEIVLDLDHDCGPVWADPTALHQVLMNLCTNAYQAIGEEGGTLRITLEHVEIPYNDARRMEIQPGTCVMISVTDTGCGMDEETIKRVFDPYFTTREGGRGTGLGLATVHGIVSGHGGTITVDSTPGEGSTFAVFLPRHIPANGPAQADDAHATDDTDLATTQADDDSAAKILFVDDEDMIVRLAVNCLEREGHHVTAFTDSNEALNAFRKTPDAFDLVITDQTMPRLTGVQLAEAIHELKPNLPVVLCTGYSETLRPDTIEEFGITKYLQKPVNIVTLQETVREISLAQRHDELPDTQ